MTKQLDKNSAAKSSSPEQGNVDDAKQANAANAANAAPPGTAGQQKHSPQTKPVTGPSKVSNAVGAFYILPGETAQQYHQGLASTIDELGAKSMVQVYVAEKIFQCLWWMRRYEAQKRSTIIAVMAKELCDSPYSADKDQRMAITQLLEAGYWDDADIKKLMQRKGYTAGSLLERAMDRQKTELIELDQSIVLKASTLQQLQKSYEALVNRSVIHERLKLQNELLKRDLLAIDVPTIKVTKDRHGNAEEAHEDAQEAQEVAQMHEQGLDG